MHRERKRSGSIPVVEEVRWTLATEYAAVVDLEKVNGNARALLSALKSLEAVLAQLDKPAPAPEGGGSGDPDPGGSAELYGRPPTVGDTPHT